MMKDETSAEGEDLFSLPSDLTEWVEPCRLMEWAEEEVARLDWKQPEVVDHLRRHPAYRPKMMLALLAYAYATQLFASEEIVRRCYEDTVYRLLSEGKAPARADLARFRRENRGLLRGILYQLLVRAIKERFSLGTILLPPGFKRYLLDNAIERLDMARHMDVTEE